MHTSTMVLRLLQAIATQTLPPARLSPTTEQAYRDAEQLRRQEQEGQR